MRNIIVVIIIILSNYYFGRTQTAADVLENGIRVERDQVLFIRYDEEKKTFERATAVAKDDREHPLLLLPVEDSSIFMVMETAIPIYLLPFNSLNYSRTEEHKVISDPIDKKAEEASGDIIKMLESLQARQPLTGAPLPCLDKFERLKDTVNNVTKKLNNSYKKPIKSLFKRLKLLSFLEEQPTIDSLSNIKVGIDSLTKHFSDLYSVIQKCHEEVEKYDCGTIQEAFGVKTAFKGILEKLSVQVAEQEKRLTNLKNAYDLALKTCLQAQAGGHANGLRWCIPLGTFPVKKGEVILHTLTVREDGYRLSDDDEIIPVEPKELAKLTLRLRRFQRFVPEVSAGIVYTFFNYHTYGTTTDSLGIMHVAPPTENRVRNFNLTTMINFTYYIPNSSINPLYQLGVGIHAGVPVLLTGIGIRSNVNGTRRLAVAGGIAMTWTKELDKLHEGDVISGTADIDNDLHYQFTWPPRLYIGLQYNF